MAQYNFNENDFKDFFKNLFKKRSSRFDSNIKKNKKNGLLISILLTIAISLVTFFFTLPSLNPTSQSFYISLIFVALVFLALSTIFLAKDRLKIGKFVCGVVISAILIPIIFSLFSSTFIRAKSYANLINVKDGDFAKDIKKIDINKMPVVDRDSAITIGQKQMGTMGDVVSQFDIDENYAQINVKGEPVRVSPLKYSDFVKNIYNSKTGIPGFINVNMATQDAGLTKLKNPIMYSNSDILFRDLNRHLRFQYPFEIFGETNFEINDENEAYYVTSLIKKRIGFFKGEDVYGAIITNAYTGESKKYLLNDIPKWVDRVFPSEMIIKQLDDRGHYKGGFLNSVFSQKNVTKTTEGYNYISMDDDVYLFTGSTSVRSDDSNIGFYFVNLRTKETKFYKVPSVSETAAMATAKNKVPEKNYKPTFPILLNINDRPVYFVALKDNSNLAKLYALIDAEKYQNVYVGSSVQETLDMYNAKNTASTNSTSNTIKKSIQIKEIELTVIDGNTYYFIKDNESKVYVGTSKQLGQKVVFLKANDKITVKVNDKTDHFDIIDIEK